MITGTGTTWMAKVAPETFIQNVVEVSEPVEGRGLAQKTRETCRKLDIRFRDPVLQLPNNTEESLEAEVGDLKWASIAEVLRYRPDLFSSSASPLQPGLLTGGYLFNALSLLFLRPHLVRRLIDCHTADNNGVYGVWIMKDGRWTEQVVDDFLPMVGITDHEMTIACSIGHDGEIWPAIIEKAYARAWGGIDQVQLGCTIGALRDLTGAAYTVFKDLSDSDVIADRLEVAIQHRWLLAAMPDTASGQSIGLLRDEYYGIVNVSRLRSNLSCTQKVLVQIMDHRRSANWKGAWSAGSPEWTPEARNNCAESDGCFWIEMADFIRLFNSLAVYMVEPSWTNLTVEINQLQSNRAISLIEVKKETEISIAVDQLDPRNHSQSTQYRYSYIRVTVARLGVDQIQFIDSKMSAQKSIFLSDRLVPGRYLVMLQAYWPEGASDRRLNLSVSSAESVTLQQAQISGVLFERIEYCLWSNFARNNRETFDSRPTSIPDCYW